VNGDGKPKPRLIDVFKAFSLELPVYAVLVVAYVCLVLHFLGGWLHELFTKERTYYAVVSVVLIVGQGFMLEILARGLLGLVKGKREK
jgi:hypothetical protein